MVFAFNVSIWFRQCLNISSTNDKWGWLLTMGKGLNRLKSLLLSILKFSDRIFYNFGVLLNLWFGLMLCFWLWCCVQSITSLFIYYFSVMCCIREETRAEDVVMLYLEIGAASFGSSTTWPGAVYHRSCDYDVGSGSPSWLHDVSNKAGAHILSLRQADVGVLLPLAFNYSVATGNWYLAYRVLGNSSIGYRA